MGKSVNVKTPNLTGAGWLRGLIYVVTVVVAVIAGVATQQGWAFADLAQTVTLLLGGLTGTTATLNLQKAPDQHRPKITEIMPVLGELLEDVKDLRSRLDGDENVDDYEPRHAAQDPAQLELPFISRS